MENNEEYQKWLEVVENDGIDLYKVPEEFKTYEMCMVAIDSDSGAIDSVPLEHKTKELCETVLRYDGFQLINVPEELRTFEMCKIALENIDDERLELLCLETAVPEAFREQLAEKYGIFPEELHELSNSEEELIVITSPQLTFLPVVLPPGVFLRDKSPVSSKQLIVPSPLGLEL